MTVSGQVELDVLRESGEYLMSCGPVKAVLIAVKVLLVAACNRCEYSNAVRYSSFLAGCIGKVVR